MPKVRPNTQLRGWTDAEEGFRVAYISGGMTFQSLLRRFRLSAQQASRIIRSDPECIRVRRERYLQDRRARVEKQKMVKNQTVVRRMFELHDDLIDRIVHLSDRVAHLENLLNVQTTVNDDGPEPE